MQAQSISFRDVTTSARRRWPHRPRIDVERGLFIDETPLNRLLAGAGRVFTDDVVALPVLPEELKTSDLRHAVPLHPGLSIEDRLAYLRSLLGEPWPEFDGLANGRVPLALCIYCFDIGCGFSSAHLRIDGDFVLWEDVGEELDEDPPEHQSEADDIDVSTKQRWTPWLYSPSVAFAFDRTQYEKVIHEEMVYQAVSG